MSAVVRIVVAVALLSGCAFPFNALNPLGKVNQPTASPSPTPTPTPTPTYPTLPGSIQIKPQLPTGATYVGQSPFSFAGYGGTQMTWSAKGCTYGFMVGTRETPVTGPLEYAATTQFLNSLPGSINQPTTRVSPYRSQIQSDQGEVDALQGGAEYQAVARVSRGDVVALYLTCASSDALVDDFTDFRKGSVVTGWNPAAPLANPSPTPTPSKATLPASLVITPKLPAGAVLIDEKTQADETSAGTIKYWRSPSRNCIYMTVAVRDLPSDKTPERYKSYSAIAMMLNPMGISVVEDKVVPSHLTSDKGAVNALEFSGTIPSNNASIVMAARASQNGHAIALVYTCNPTSLYRASDWVTFRDGTVFAGFDTPAEFRS